jgi:hypothetical protein
MLLHMQGQHTAICLLFPLGHVNADQPCNEQVLQQQ